MLSCKCHVLVLRMDVSFFSGVAFVPKLLDRIEAKTHVFVRVRNTVLFSEGISDSLFWSQEWVTMAWRNRLRSTQIPRPRMIAISWSFKKKYEQNTENNKSRYFSSMLVEISAYSKMENLCYRLHVSCDDIPSFWIGISYGSFHIFQRIYLIISNKLGHMQRREINVIRGVKLAQDNLALGL